MSRANLRLIEQLCADIGPRPSGSAAEQRAAERLSRQLNDLGVVTQREPFAVTPRAIQLLLVCIVAGYLGGLVLYLLGHSGWALGVLALAVGNYVAHTVWGYHLGSLFLPAWPSTNVVGKIPAREARRRLILFAGHLDSAYRMPIFARSTLPLLAASLVGLVVGTVVLGLLSAAQLLLQAQSVNTTEPWAAVGIGLCLLAAVGAVGMLVGTLRPDAVAGANDNLSGISVAWALAHHVVANPLRYTEVWVVAFGSEEAVLAGSRAFVRQHRRELADAWLVNFESLGQAGELRVVTRELQSMVKHSPTLNGRLLEAARALGVSLRPHLLTFGLTDAASFSHQGLTATTLIRLDDQGLLEHYHTALDVPEHVQEAHLDEAVRVCCQFLDEVDGAATTIAESAGDRSTTPK